MKSIVNAVYNLCGCSLGNNEEKNNTQKSDFQNPHISQNIQFKNCHINISNSSIFSVPHVKGVVLACDFFLKNRNQFLINRQQLKILRKVEKDLEMEQAEQVFGHGQVLHKLIKLPSFKEQIHIFFIITPIFRGKEQDYLSLQKGLQKVLKLANEKNIQSLSFTDFPIYEFGFPRQDYGLLLAEEIFMYLMENSCKNRIFNIQISSQDQNMLELLKRVFVIQEKYFVNLQVEMQMAKQENIKQVYGQKMSVGIKMRKSWLPQSTSTKRRRNTMLMKQLSNSDLKQFLQDSQKLNISLTKSAEQQYQQQQQQSINSPITRNLSKSFLSAGGEGEALISGFNISGIKDESGEFQEIEEEYEDDDFKSCYEYFLNNSEINLSDNQLL